MTIFALVVGYRFTQSDPVRFLLFNRKKGWDAYGSLIEFSYSLFLFYIFYTVKLISYLCLILLFPILVLSYYFNYDLIFKYDLSFIFPYYPYIVIIWFGIFFIQSGKKGFVHFYLVKKKEINGDEELEFIRFRPGVSSKNETENIDKNKKIIKNYFKDFLFCEKYFFYSIFNIAKVDEATILQHYHKKLHDPTPLLVHAFTYAIPVLISLKSRRFIIGILPTLDKISLSSDFLSVIPLIDGTRSLKKLELKNINDHAEIYKKYCLDLFDELDEELVLSFIDSNVYETLKKLDNDQDKQKVWLDEFASSQTLDVLNLYKFIKYFAEEDEIDSSPTLSGVKKIALNASYSIDDFLCSIPNQEVESIELMHTERIFDSILISDDIKKILEEEKNKK